MGDRAREINAIFKQIGIESEEYNLRLNHSKCFYIGLSGTENINPKDKTEIKKSDGVTFLCGTITSSANRNAEISARMIRALAAC